MYYVFDVRNVILYEPKHSANPIAFVLRYI